jgi:hypothetical protein
LHQLYGLSILDNDYVYGVFINSTRQFRVFRLDISGQSNHSLYTIGAKFPLNDATYEDKIIGMCSPQNDSSYLYIAAT